MPRTTARANALQNLLGMVRPQQPMPRGVLGQLSPDQMPHAPSGPEDPNMPSRGSQLLPASSHTYKNAELIEAPVLDRQTGNISMGRKMQTYLDPEHHIATTSRAPGSTGMNKRSDVLPTSERAAAGMMGEPVPAYGGSTDARPGGLEHRSTRRVWNQKTREAAQPKGTTKRQRVYNPDTGKREMADVPVHGAGLLDSLRSGESIRNPAHLIIDPSPPKYGPRLNTQGYVEEGDEGGFGHDQPVQWQGHHRVAAAAMHQKERRESGAKDWAVPVPYDLHLGADAALAHIPMMEASEHITDTRHKRRSMLRQVLGGNRGTWNPKAY